MTFLTLGTVNREYQTCQQIPLLAKGFCSLQKKFRVVLVIKRYRLLLGIPEKDTLLRNLQKVVIWV